MGSIVQRLKGYVEQGQVISGSLETVNEQGKSVTMIVWLRKANDNTYEVEIEVYYSNIDVRSLNIRDETRSFADLEEAIAFIEGDTGIGFNQMRRS